MWNIVWRDNRVQFPQQKMSLSYSLLNNTMSWRSQLLLTSISTQAIIICCTYSTLTQWQAAFVSRFPLFDFCHSSCCCCCYCMLLYRSCKMIRLKLIQCSNFNKSCFFGNFLFFSQPPLQFLLNMLSPSSSPSFGVASLLLLLTMSSCWFPVQGFCIRFIVVSSFSIFNWLL